MCQPLFPEKSAVEQNLSGISKFLSDDGDESIGISGSEGMLKKSRPYYIYAGTEFFLKNGDGSDFSGLLTGLGS